MHHPPAAVGQRAALVFARGGRSRVHHFNVTEECEVSAIPRTVQRPAAASRRLLQHLRTNMAEAVVVYGQVEGDIHTQGHQKGNAAHKEIGGEILEQ